MDWGWIIDILEAVFDAITDFLAKPIEFLFAQPAYELPKEGTELYNAFAGASYNVISMDPQSAGGGSLWGLVENINNAFTPFAASFAVVLLLITFCSSSLDVKDNMRFETVLKLYLKISLVEFLVVHNMDILKNIMKICYGLLKVTGLGQGAVTINISRYIKPDDCKDGSGTLVLLLLGLVVFMVCISCGVSLLFCAYKRVFKLLLVIPFGSFAFATFAGKHEVNRTGVTYIKYVVSTFAEAIVMLAALALCAKLNMSDPSVLLQGSGSLGVFSTIYGKLVLLSLNCLITLGLVKSSEGIVHKAMAI